MKRIWAYFFFAVKTLRTALKNFYVSVLNFKNFHAIKHD